MRNGFWNWKRLAPAAIMAGILCAGNALAQDAKKEEAKKEEVKKDVPSPAAMPSLAKLTLGQCISIGLERNPTLKAARAAIDAAHSSKQGLDDIGRLASLFSPDLPCRKLQACHGLTAVAAEMSAAEQEITYAVTRMYYTVVYAREQEQLTKDLVDSLDAYLVQVKAIVNSKEGGGGNKEINKNTEDRLVIARSEAIIKRNEAEAGVNQAFAALREAMGYAYNEPLDVADSKLPEIQAEVNRDTVIQFASTNRPEVILASVGADVARIEVMAQWKLCFRPRASTFASGSDIHSIAIAAGSRGDYYYPQPLSPRMPTQLVGNHATRANTARAYTEYADALVEKTKGLVTLEAQNSYEKFMEAHKNVSETKLAAKTGKELIERLREAQGTKLNEQMILTSEASYTLAVARYNKSLHDQILALANLERISAGGIKVAYPGR